jgi:threonine dehydrogenase-like Zn-dependent dehydrogenase
VAEVPDPVIQEPTDAIVRITSTAICGSDLHLYEVLGPYMHKGDVIGHEPMGIVEEVGSGVTNLRKGDRVVVPFNIACGHCYFCAQGLQSQCETTQVKDKGSGAALFGYSELYGSVPGGQAEYLRVPHADYGPIKVGTELAGRTVPVPLRHPSHRLAGRGVRAHVRLAAPWPCSVWGP